MDQRSAWDFSALVEVGRAIAAAAHDPQELAEVTYLETARLVATDYFQLGVFEGNQYRTLIWVRDGNRVENLSFNLDEHKENIIGWVRRNGEPLLVGNFEEELDQLPATPAYEAEDPPLSGLFLPLQVGHSTIGLVALQSRTPYAFTEQHLQLFTIINHSLAASLTHLTYRQETEFLTLHMVLIQEISHLLMSLDPLSERLQQVVTLMAEVLAFDEVAIFANIDGHLTLQTCSTPLTEGSTQSVIPALVKTCADQARIQIALPDEDDQTALSDPAMEYAFPLQVVEKLLGVLHVRSRQALDLEGEQGKILAMLASQLAFTMLEARNYDERQEEAWMTTVLLEVAKHAAQPGDTLVALQAVLQLATLLAGTDWALLLLPDDSGENLYIGPSAGFRRQETLPFESLRVARNAFQLDPPYLESALPTPTHLPETLGTALGQTQALCLKLSDGENLLGLLLMQEGPLPGIRPSLLAGIGYQVSLRLENARLIEEAAIRRSLERELMMARNIQASFLPESMPEVAGWQLESSWEVAREVGGDFYDIIPLPQGPNGERWGIVIADVADKGIPAALYMALSRTMLRSVAQVQIHPARTLEIVNKQLFSDTHSDLFVSAFYAVWEPKTGLLTYANAGHLPPFLFKPGQRGELIREHGMVLGVMPEAKYNDQHIELIPGDLLVLYTDGVTEAQNHDQEFFGFQRLESLILSQETLEASAITKAIVDRVIEFSGSREFSDDLTTVALHREQ